MRETMTCEMLRPEKTLTILKSPWVSERIVRPSGEGNGKSRGDSQG